jgi:hypothetical protein
LIIYSSKARKRTLDVGCNGQTPSRYHIFFPATSMGILYHNNKNRTRNNEEKLTAWVIEDLLACSSSSSTSSCKCSPRKRSRARPDWTHNPEANIYYSRARVQYTVPQICLAYQSRVQYTVPQIIYK